MGTSRVGGPPSPSVVQQRLKQSVDELLEADQKNPDQGSGVQQANANPYRAQTTGWNGAVDKKEAAGTGKMAQATFGAAAKAWGKKVTEGGSGNWVDKSYEKQEVSGPELRRLQGLASSMVEQLTGADGNISDAKLEQLPAIVQDFWVKKFGPGEKLTPDALDAVVKMIRTAAE